MQFCEIQHHTKMNALQLSKYEIPIDGHPKHKSEPKGFNEPKYAKYAKCKVPMVHQIEGSAEMHHVVGDHVCAFFFTSPHVHAAYICIMQFNALVKSLQRAIVCGIKSFPMVGNLQRGGDCKGRVQGVPEGRKFQLA